MTSVCLRLTPGEGTQLNGLNWLMRAVRLLAKHDGTPSPNSQNSSFSTISIFCQSGLTPAQPLRCHDSRIYWGIFFFYSQPCFPPIQCPRFWLIMFCLRSPQSPLCYHVNRVTCHALGSQHEFYPTEDFVSASDNGHVLQQTILQHHILTTFLDFSFCMTAP